MPSIKVTARLAGGLYLATLPFGFFGLLYVNSDRVLGLATAGNLEAAVHLLRLGVASDVIGQVLFIGVPLLLYQVFAPASRRAAVLMVVFLLLSIPMELLSEVGRLEAVRALTATTPGASAQFFLDLYQDGIFVTSVFWGLWLLPLGWLAYRSRFVPRLVGIVVFISGVSYLADIFVHLLFPGRSLPFVEILRAGELLLPLWLAIMGVSVAQWETGARG
jgi:hypothetical protein